MKYPSMKSSRGALAVAALGLLATGGLTGCERGAPAGPATGAGACAEAAPCVETNPNAPAIWRAQRLGPEPLAHTFQTLLGVVPMSLSLLPVDETALGAEPPPPSAFEVDLYRQVANEAAELGASQLVERCSSDATCLENAVLELAERAYRGPLDASEQRTYRAVLEAGADPHGSVRDSLALLFQAPRFLYLMESGALGDGSELVRDLTPWEIAARLSYFLWAEPPDDALRKDAASGHLADEAVLRAHAKRMLLDERAARTFGAVLRTWAAPGLGSIAKADSVYPEFGPPLRTSMMDQFEQFASMALREGATLREMLTTERVPVDGQLARLLGVPVPDGKAWTVASLPTPRFGLLTLPGTLTANAGAADSSPVLRGLFVRQKLLCQSIPPPPPDAPSLPPLAADSKASAREHLEAHTQDPVCASCHKRMDPLGFPFEIYDGLGRMRAEADELRTDGTLSNVKKPTDFDDLAGLVAALTSASEVSRCWTAQWLERATGNSAMQGSAALEELSARAAGELPWADLIVEIVATPAFRQVDRPAGE